MQFVIFILQNVRKLSSSHLPSSKEGEIDLHLRLQSYSFLKLKSTNLPENLQGAPTIVNSNQINNNNKN